MPGIKKKFSSIKKYFTKKIRYKKLKEEDKSPLLRRSTPFSERRGFDGPDSNDQVGSGRKRRHRRRQTRCKCTIKRKRIVHRRRRKR